MKKFNVIEFNSGNVEGVGYYQRSGDTLFVEAVDNSILSEFRSLIKNKQKIQFIHFKGLDSDGSFGGPFMVINIRGNDIELKKV